MEQDVLYTELVERLLYMDSVESIKRALDSIPALDVTRLYATLDSLAETYRSTGKTARYKLLDFVRQNIEKEFPRAHAASAPLPSPISTLDELIQQAVLLPDSVRVYLLLRRYSQLLNRDAFERLLGEAYAAHKGALEWIRVVSVLGLLLGGPSIVARAYLAWGGHCRDRGLYWQAVRHLSHAAHIAGGVDDSWLRMSVSGALGTLLALLGEMTSAVEYYQHAVDVATQQGDERAANLIRQRLVKCYSQMQRYADALQLVDECIPVARKFGETKDEARCHIAKGLILENIGRYDEGEAEYRQGLQLAEQLDDRGLQFETLNDIGFSAMKRGLYSQGYERFKYLLEKVKSWGNPVMIASAHNNFGNVLLERGDKFRGDKTNEDRSREDYAAALNEFFSALMVKADAQDARGESISYIGLGDAFYALKEQEQANFYYANAIGPAIRLLEQAGDPFGWMMYASRVATGKADAGEDAVGTISYARDLARAVGNQKYELLLTSYLIEQQIEQGHEQAAIDMYREVIEQQTDQQLVSTQVMGLHLGLAKLLARQQDGRQEAYQLLTALLARLDIDMQGVILNVRRAEIVSQWIDVYGLLIKLLIEDADSLTLPAAVDPQALAFDLHEAAKARAFIAYLASGAMHQPETIPQHLREHESLLLAAVRELQDENAEQDTKIQAFRLRRLRELSAELHACWEEMKPFAPEYVRLRSGEPMTLQGLTTLLSTYATTSMAVVSFFCDDQSTTCFVIRSDEKQLSVFRTGIGRQQLNDAVQKMRTAFNGDKILMPIPALEPETRDYKLRTFTALSKDLLAFLSMIQGCELLCIVPHGPLHMLPFHALRTPEDRFLIEQCAVTYTPSLSALQYCLSKQARPSVVNPSVYVAGVSAHDDARPEFFEHDDDIFRALHWPMTADMGVYAASKLRVLAQLPRHEIIHLTCHGSFDAGDALNSGLLLSNGSAKAPDLKSVSVMERYAYLLTARDFLRTPLNARIVTLRACSTGIQKERNSGDELEGLTRSLLYAGSASVIVSLWNVDQETSLTLMSRFYQYWAAKEQPREKWRALWMAQKDFLAAGDGEHFLRHFYHWAPLILIGDWR